MPQSIAMFSRGLNLPLSLQHLSQPLILVTWRICMQRFHKLFRNTTSNSGLNNLITHSSSLEFHSDIKNNHMVWVGMWPPNHDIKLKQLDW